MNRPPPVLLSMMGIGLHLMVLVGLPLVLARFCLRVSESNSVLATSGVLGLIVGMFLGISLGLLLIGAGIKTFRMLWYRRLVDGMGLARVLSTLERNLRILTPRGWMVLFWATFFVVSAVSLSWAALGVMAVLSLFVFYGLLGLYSFLSSIQTFALAPGLTDQFFQIRRQVIPAVLLAGDDAEERIHLDSVPVPMGMSLIIEDPNPPRLQSATRYAVGAQFLGRKTGLCTVSGRFRCTPRGLHRLGPARLSYRDAFGFSRFPVVAWAEAEMKVLPRFKKLVVEAAPTSVVDSPDALTRLHRFATEDPFRFKDYASGDDTRRIHWRLSIRAGNLQVRVPESRETHSKHILLMLDTWMDPSRDLSDAIGRGRILDDLVEAWLALAAALVLRGDRITLISMVDDGSGQLTVESVDGREDRRRWQDLGARAEWQGHRDLAEVLKSTEIEADEAIAVSSRLNPVPTNLTGPRFTWIYLSPSQALGPPLGWMDRLRSRGWLLPTSILNWAFRLPAPTGSIDNSLLHRVRRLLKAWWLHAARYRLATTALEEEDYILDSISGRGESIYRLLVEADGYRVVRFSTESDEAMSA